MKTIRVILAALCLLVAANIQAQHYVTGSLQGGWSSTFDNMDQTKDKGLFGAQIGVGYEWQYERLLLDLGVEFSYYKHRWNITDQNISQTLYDTEGWPFVYNGTVTNRIDDFSSTSIRIPLLAGMQFGYFYFLAGVVPDLHFKGTAHASGTLNTVGDYTEFYDILHDMSNHGFYQVAQSTENNMQYKFDLLGHVEAGFSFGQQQKYRLAAFAEVGMLDIAPRSDIGKLTEPDFSQYLNVNLNNPYLSTEGAFANLHKYEVGLKFSVAITVAGNKEEKEKDDEDKGNELDSLDNALQDSLDQILFAEAAKQLEEPDNTATISEFDEDDNSDYAYQMESPSSSSQNEYAARSKPFGPDTQLSKQELNKGDQYTLQKIYFDTNLAYIQVASLPTLKQLYKHLLLYPDLKIKIIGHTDSQANDYYNLILSRRRAESVKRTLMRWGIEASRLKTEGRGERQPVATNRTEEGRQLNRRVVFEVL